MDAVGNTDVDEGEEDGGGADVHRASDCKKRAMPATVTLLLLLLVAAAAASVEAGFSGAGAGPCACGGGVDADSTGELPGVKRFVELDSIERDVADGGRLGEASGT